MHTPSLEKSSTSYTEPSAFVVLTLRSDRLVCDEASLRLADHDKMQLILLVGDMRFRNVGGKISLCSSLYDLIDDRKRYESK
jgi:hypothetical protein